MSGRHRAAALVVLPLAGALALTGCGLNPPDGVRVDRRVADSLDEPDVRRLPSGPRPGDAPEDVVRGFLGAAAADPAAGHDPARPFLAGDAAWDATAGAVVYAPESLTLRVLARGEAPASTGSGGEAGADATKVRLTADRLATVAPDGAFLPAAGRVRQDVDLVRSDQEWRIARAPAGLLLTPRDLTRGYRAASRYFLAPGVGPGGDRVGDRLVADPVYVPGNRATAPGTAVRALLSGPSTWLAPAVRTAIPAGVTTSGSVVVTDGTASVDLTRTAFDVPDARRPVVVGQIAATLGSLPGVESVQVTVEGRPYQEGDPTVVAAAPAALRTVVDGPTYALGADGRLRRVVGPADGTAGAAPEPPPEVVDVPGAPAGLVAAVPDPGGSSTLAARQRTAGGTRLLVGPLGDLRVADLPPGELVGPSWVPGRGAVVGRVTGAGAARRTELQIVDPSGTAHPLADVTALGALRELAVSPDGARIVVRTGPAEPERVPGDASTLWLGRLGQVDGRLRAEGWVAVATGLDGVARPSWSATTSLTVTGRRGGSSGLWRLAIDRLVDPERIPTEGLPGPVDALSAAPGRDLLAVVDGRLYRQGTDRWELVGAAVAVAQPQ